MSKLQGEKRTKTFVGLPSVHEPEWFSAKCGHQVSAYEKKRVSLESCGTCYKVQEDDFHDLSRCFQEKKVFAPRILSSIAWVVDMNRNYPLCGGGYVYNEML